MSPKHPLYPGQLPVFRFEIKLKPNRIRPKQIRPKQIRPKQIRPKQTRPNVAKHRTATRISMSTLRRRKLQQFDYETYRADFAKRYVSTISSTDALAFSIYNILMMIWKKTSETGLQTFPTQRPCMPTFIIKFMIYYTISSAHLADALDMIDRIILSCLSSTNDFLV
jgi:hypothetical protein